MDLCIHDCEMSSQLKASVSFFSYFRVEIVGPIFLRFLKKKKKKKKKNKKKKKKKNRFFDVVIDFNHKACHLSANNKRTRAAPSYRL